MTQGHTGTLKRGEGASCLGRPHSLLRVAALASILLLATPFAQAGPALASVAVGPEGPAQDGEPYYARVALAPPEGPAAGTADQDCASDRRPRGFERLAALANAIAAWDPTQEFRVSGWFPTCVAATVSPCAGPTTECPAPSGPLAYASYDLTTGRYFVQVPVRDTGLPIRLDGASPQTAQSIILTGTTGVAIVTDCEACPTPP